MTKQYPKDLAEKGSEPARNGFIIATYMDGKPTGSSMRVSIEKMQQSMKQHEISRKEKLNR